jgi:hypothetical protein
MIIGIFYPRDRRYQGKSLLKVEDLNSAKGDDKIDRLIDIFNHLISHNAQDLIARQNERTQTRISYIALMAALIIAVLPLEEMEIRMQFGIVLIELFLFLV